MANAIQLRAFRQTGQDETPSGPVYVNLAGKKPASTNEKTGITNDGFDAGEVFASQSSGQALPVHNTDTAFNGDVPPGQLALVQARPAETEGLEDDDPGCCLSHIQRAQEAMDSLRQSHGDTIRLGFGCLLLLAYCAYFIFAMYLSLEGSDQVRLLVMTVASAAICLLVLITKTCGTAIYEKIFMPIVGCVRQRYSIFKWVFIIGFCLALLIFVIVDVGITQPRNLVSCLGLFGFTFLLFIFSANPAKVRWRPVFWGLGLQFVFALAILKTSWGFEGFKWLGQRVSEFLLHANAGAEFVFGESYEDHLFAFKVLPVVIFFSSVISILYYLGIMQLAILGIAWVMQKTLGTTAAESVNAAGNIFIGMTEAPLMIRPLIEDMTQSELFAVMVGGFATIAGSVMASFIILGVEPNHLITASVMAAPCALAMSKLNFPETKKSHNTEDDVAHLEKSPQRNVIEAASAGASGAIVLVANMAANIIAFISLLTFVNATLEWMGSRVGMVPPDYPILTFQLICSYVLWPFAFAMGIDTADCRKVGELIGVKTFINEFVAYTELGKLIANRKVLDDYDGAWEWVNDDIVLAEGGIVLKGGVISPRSVVISTYALCGFANVGSMGVVLGGLGAISPSKKPLLAEIAVRAMITGNVVCFLNACVAGLLYAGS